MQCPPAVRPSRPSRHPTEFLTASLLPTTPELHLPPPQTRGPHAPEGLAASVLVCRRPLRYNATREL
ncbi:hypothetical protein CMEL01_13451 [Colletotrichum melonis]|uniref:Uncharacterized protein n=1 Tax=Colletotrichum melonis TaxID=1209925 RepID=A0AAI9UU08_9PEZI|nr:hypothetical protein CMEL01_13451 [Colletotrichum melonis]